MGKMLGDDKTYDKLIKDLPSADILETFENKVADRQYQITHHANEFTCVCPKTMQPDFGQLHVRYVPDKLCVELKSLKVYLMSYRNCGEFHEHVVNRILTDLVNTVHPERMAVTGVFNIRGGIHTEVEAVFDKVGGKE